MCFFYYYYYYMSLIFSPLFLFSLRMVLKVCQVILVWPLLADMMFSLSQYLSYLLDSVPLLTCLFSLYLNPQCNL
jgi:hypothetical protein